MLSLYAVAFGSYAAHLISLTGNVSLDSHIFLTGIVVFATLLNYIGLRLVSISESIAVYTKLIILGLFVLIGSYGLFNSSHLGQLAFSEWETPFKLLTGGMVIFVAYEGFELIANASDDIENPDKNIPRAFYISVVFVVILYILIATITVGSLSFNEVQSAEEYVLAEAAKPLLGQVGFTVIAITAMISTFSAINATVYGGSRVNYKTAESEEFPQEFTKQLWDQPIGLIVTVGLTLLAANTLNLESISTSGSSGFLLVFGVVNLANFRLAEKTNSRKFISLTAALLCFIALATLLFQQFTSNRIGAATGIAIIIFAYLMEIIYKYSRGKWEHK